MNRRQFLLALTALTTPALSTAISRRIALSSDFGERLENPDEAAGRGITLTGEPTTPLTPSAPLTLTASDANVVISGKHFKDVLDDGSYAIHIRGDHPNQRLNIEITDCLFENARWAIRVDNAADIKIHGNRFVNCGQAIRVSESSTIRVDHNEFKDIGQIAVLNHGYGAYWAQNAVSFINVTGPGNSVSWNIVDNSGANAPYLEDCISFWNSGGVASSWAVIEGNQLRGDTPGSSTGTGIIVGDAVGATTLYAHHVRIRNNTCVRMQSIGIGVAGGHDYDISGNRIYLPLEHALGLSQHPYNRENNPTPGGGIMVFDYSETLECHSIALTGNEAYAIRADDVANPFWADRGSCSQISETGNIWHWDKNNSGGLSDDILPRNLFASLNTRYFSGNRQV